MSPFKQVHEEYSYNRVIELFRRSLMRLALMLILAYNLNATSYRQEQVCLLIDTHGMNQQGYRTVARSFDSLRYFEVYHMTEACFDLNKVYSMESLIEEQDIVEGNAQCLYIPHPKDEGKVLYYQSQGQNMDCLIENAFSIDLTQKALTDNF